MIFFINFSDRFDNPASVSDTPARQMTYNYLLPINFWLLLFPADLCCDWTMGTIPVIKSIVDYRNLVTLGFYVLFGKVVYFALCKQGRLNRALIMVILVLIMFIKFKKNSYKEALILVIVSYEIC